VIWLNPAAWIGLLAIAGPILIHILMQRKAERLAFPSLRFLQQGRLASIRRHLLEDVPLLAIRAAIVGAAVAALAAPLIVTRTQRQAWNARVVRAIVVDGVARAFSASARGDVGRATADAPKREEREGGQARDRGPERAALQPPAFLSQTFETPAVADAIPRAIAWLENAPPARRELLIAGPLALGSVSAEDLAVIPPGIGIRFEQSGGLPAERSVAGGRVLGLERERRQPSPRLGLEREGFSRAAGSGPIVVQQQVTLKDIQTSVQETGAAVSDPFPVEVVCSTDARPIVDAAIAVARSERVWASATNRRGRLVLLDPSIDPAAIAHGGPITESWIADAVASIARDRDLQAAAAQTPALLSGARFSAMPWQPLLLAPDGRAAAVAAASNASLVVVSGATPSSLVTPLLLRAMANALGGPPDLRQAEVLQIPESQLRAWSRPPAPVIAPRVDRVERDDRRGVWILVLALLALETWVRRAKAEEKTSTDEEDARVA
jgi:Aerotolerance regulator N-terminal